MSESTDERPAEPPWWDQLLRWFVVAGGVSHVGYAGAGWFGDDIDAPPSLYFIAGFFMIAWAREAGPSLIAGWTTAQRRMLVVVWLIAVALMMLTIVITRDVS